jgi:hypothetical protein
MEQAAEIPFPQSAKPPGGPDFRIVLLYLR